MSDDWETYELQEQVGDLQEENRRMQCHIKELQQTVADLRGILRQGAKFTAEWDLTPAQERILSALLTRPSLTYHQAEIAAQRGDKEVGDGYRLVTQTVFQLRRKLARHGINVATMRGVGYRLDDENKKKVRLGLTSGLNVES